MVLDRIEIEMEGKEDRRENPYYFGFSRAPLMVDLRNTVFLVFTHTDPATGKSSATLCIKERDHEGSKG